MIKAGQLTVMESNPDFGWASLSQVSVDSNESFAAMRVDLGTHKDAFEAEKIARAIQAKTVKMLRAWGRKKYLVVCDCVAQGDKVRLHKGLFYKEKHIEGIVYQDKRDTQKGKVVLIGVVEINENNATEAISRSDSFRTFFFLTDDTYSARELADVAVNALSTDDTSFCALDFTKVVSQVCRHAGWVIRILWGTSVALILYGCRDDQLFQRRILKELGGTEL